MDRPRLVDLRAGLPGRGALVSPSTWKQRLHSDPYCAGHCSAGHKHSQCGCSCNHRRATSSPDRWQGAYSYALAHPEIDDAAAFADEFAAYIEDRMHEIQYPDLPLPTPEEYELAHR